MFLMKPNVTRHALCSQITPPQEDKRTISKLDQLLSTLRIFFKERLA